MRFEGEVYRYIFASRTGDDAFVERAKATVASFRAMTDADRRHIHHLEVRIVTAKPGDTTRTLATQMRGVANAAELFLVLNSLYDGDAVIPGANYKIVDLD